MRFDQPVGTQAERDAPRAWAGAWFSVVKYAQRYTPPSGDSYHTGDDLNLPNFADVGAPVYASAGGEVVTAGAIAGWGGLMVCIKHAGAGENGADVWTRYAHLQSLQVRVGDNVRRGQIVGYIGDYTPAGPSNDHLHFDVARIDLGARPGDWPRLDLTRLLRDYINPLEWINSHREDDMPVTKWTPTDAQLGTRVRLTPSTDTTANIAGVIPGSAVVDGEESADGKWVTLKLTPERMTVSGVVLQPSVNPTFDAFAARQFMKPASVPAPQPPPASDTVIGKHPALPALAPYQRLGIHALNRIEEMREAFNLGCRVFTSLDNISGAREIRARGAAVIVRRYMDHGPVVNATEFARNFGIEASDTLICMGTNEADNISTSDLRMRFAWDREWALEMHRLYPHCFIVIGSFSMGTPQIENPDVARVFRETYAQFLNANASWCGLNYHNYHRRHSPDLPPASEAVQDPAWWPQRFIRWGFDPAFGGLSKAVVMMHDESGVDIGGIGGFPPSGYNEQTFLSWWQLHNSWFGAWPNIYCHNLFQAGPSERWAGYDVRQFFAACARVWSGALLRSINATPADVNFATDYGDSPVVEPPPKPMD